MLRRLRRKLYRRVRFKTWFRKTNYYHRKHGRIDEYIARFKTAAELSDKKYMAALRRDMIRCLLKYGAYFDEYFLFGFEGRDEEYRASFITEGIRLDIYPRMNDTRKAALLENKYSTYKKFKDYYKREIMWVRTGGETSPETLDAFKSFTVRHPRFAVKPTYAAFGKGFRIVCIDEFDSCESAYEQFHEQGVVLEELIIQDERMGVLHPASVNTLRVPTVLVKDENGRETVELFHPTLRVGQHGSLIDNTSSGGISALIDPHSGKIISDGADKLGHRYECHPDTKLRFKGFQIPEWEKVVEIVSAVAHEVPGYRYVGWDLALFEDRGWCMVEANNNAQMSGMQFVTQEGRRQELEALISRM